MKGLQKVHEEVLVEPDEATTVDDDEQPVDESLIKDLEENAGDAGLSIEENE